MKSKTNLITILVFTAACVAAAGQAELRGELSGISEIDLRYHVGKVDEAYIMLLDRHGISNYPQWRENFSGHVLGFGVRSERKRLEEADLARVKEILLDEASFAGEEKMCISQGDCALLMRSPIGEVLVMFELWCGRIYMRVETRLSGSFYGHIDPVAPEFQKMVLEYFEDDEYFRDLVNKSKK